MKKFVRIILFSILTAVSFAACTEEEVKPQTEGSNAGGSPIKD
jgi:hypothetical protein